MKRDPRDYKDFNHILWERSFILPEHKRALQRYYEDSSRQEPPAIAEELAEEHYQLLKKAVEEGARVSIRFWRQRDGQYQEVSGVPRNLDNIFLTVEIRDHYIVVEYITHLSLEGMEW
ncbi:YolD-like family protein [Bacillaceae bacterium SIJ1]|uniref:YolD-like family protein n=1 Tax=Litoribacterium kuwaitense TaxID=1398745 RepID=UPI0013ED7E48|nr:YolD-like family protein [Litoribacterium kuwaitense]NGP43473.1 YolD-like family protein [Litoribacterium kuwaitense]